MFELKLPETKYQESHCICLDFLMAFRRRDLSPLFWPGFLFFIACVAVHHLAVYWVLGSLIKQTLTRRQRVQCGRVLVKNDFIFYLRMSQLGKSVQYVY